jgi:hypothetical protein
VNLQPIGTWIYGPATNLSPAPPRAQIVALQAALAAMPQAEVGLQHLFSPGQYTRVCTLAPGVYVGKIHRHQHPTFLMSGTCRINTDRGMETITGPHVWISQPDAKRALVCLTDCVFATVHLNPTDTTDLDAIEVDVIVPESLTHEATALEHDALQEVFA